MTNQFRMRKYFARLFLPFLFVWFTVMPSRAYAIVPLIAYGVSFVSTAGVTISAADVAGLAIAAAGVAAIAYMKITAPDGSSIAVPAGGSVPAPAAAPNVTPTESTDGTCFVQYGATVYLDVQPACDAMYADQIAPRGDAQYFTHPTAAGTVPLHCQPSVSIGVCNYSYGSSPQSYTLYSSGTSTPAGVVECPSGYVLNGATCDLADARMAVDDKRQDFSRGLNNNFELFSGDQQGSISGIQGTTNTAGDSLSFIGSNGGKPSSVTVVAQPGGGYLITQSTQQQDGAGITYVSNSTINIDATGGIIGNSGSAVSGSLDTNNASAAGGASIVSPAAGAIPAAPASSSPIVFPSDYARVGEAAAAAVPITNSLDTLHNDLSVTTATVDPVLPTEIPGWGNTFTDLLSWQLPAHASACPTPELDLSGVLGAGHTYVMNSHCGLIQDNFDTFNAAMIVVWSTLALFIVLRA